MDSSVARIAQLVAHLVSTRGLAMYLCHAGSNPTGVASKNIDLKKISMVPASVCTNGLTITFRARWFHRVFSD